MRRVMFGWIGLIMVVVLVEAIGANPRMIEELRIGGGYSESVDGGCDIEDDGTITTNGVVTGNRYVSSVATGTAPVGVTSTTLCTNLNADLWDGYQFANYLDQAVKTSSSPTFSTILTSSNIRQFGTTDSSNLFDLNIRQGTTLNADGVFRFGRDTDSGSGTLYSKFYNGSTASVIVNHKTGELSTIGDTATTNLVLNPILSSTRPYIDAPDGTLQIVDDDNLGTELVTNGGFEGTYTAGVAASWSFSGGTGVPSEEGTDIHGGSKAQKLTIPSEAANNILSVATANAFTVTPGLIYKIVFWAKVTSGKIYFVGLSDGTNYSYAFDSSTGITTNAWTQYTYYVPVQFSSASTKIIIGNRYSSAGTFLLDDLSVKQVVGGDLYVAGNVVGANTLLPAQAGISTVGLVGLWHCNSATSLIDYSNSGETMTVGGSGTTLSSSGKYGSAVTFNGSGYFVSGTNAIPNTYSAGNFSMGCWYYGGNTSSWQSVMGWGNGGSENTCVLQVSSSTGYARAYTRVSGTDKTISGASSIADSKWHHIFMTFNDSSNVFKLYVDGVYINQETAAGNPTQNMYFYIGAGNASTNRLTGSVDCVSVWNKELSASEIRSLYMTESELFTGYYVNAGIRASGLYALSGYVISGVADTTNGSIYSQGDNNVTGGRYYLINGLNERATADKWELEADGDHVDIYSWSGITQTLRSYISTGGIVTTGTFTGDAAAIGGGYGSTGVTISNAGNVQANGTLTVDGTSTFGNKITTYNNVATEGYGVPAIVDKVGAIGLTTATTTTNFTNAGTAGDYRISYYSVITTTEASDSITWTMKWNDGTAAQSIASSALSTATNGYVQGVVYCHLGSGSVSYESAYSGSRSTAVWSFYATCERLN